MNFPITRHRMACLAVVLMAATSGCSAESAGDPLPSSSPSTSPSTSPSDSPGPTPQARGADLSDTDRAVYEEALTRWMDYQRDSAPIWAAGKVTAQSTDLFREYWVTHEALAKELRSNELSDFRITSDVTVLESWPASVTRSEHMTQAVIEECIDPSTLAFTLPSQGEVSAPYVRTVTLVRAGDSPFKISLVADLSNRDEVESCSG